MKKKTPSWNYELAKSLMIEKGLKRKIVAEYAKMEVDSLTQSLNGRKPSLQTIKLLSQVLGCTEEDLLNPPARGQAAS